MEQSANSSDDFADVAIAGLTDRGAAPRVFPREKAEARFAGLGFVYQHLTSEQHLDEQHHETTAVQDAGTSITALLALLRSNCRPQIEHHNPQNTWFGLRTHLRTCRRDSR